MSIAPLIVSWSHYGRFFFFAKKERALLITHETGYILSQSTTPRIGESAHATLQSVTCILPANCASSSAISFCSLLTNWKLTPASKLDSYFISLW
jgi:DNA recombination-dependent growth factor C